MRVIIYIFTLFILLNHINLYSTDQTHFEIKLLKQHPFLVDHQKLLLVSYNGKQVINELLYSDPGGGSPCSLFIENNIYILIDSNGVWYKIRNGKLISKLWAFGKKLPKKYICTYKHDKIRNVYEKVIIKNITTKLIYIYRDPYDYINNKDFEIDRDI